MLCLWYDLSEFMALFILFNLWINKLTTEINTRLGERLEITKHRLRKPRLIIYNVPTEITIENIAATIIAQNPEIQTNGENIEAKYKFKDRKGRYNIVIEVGPKTRQQILQLKLNSDEKYVMRQITWYQQDFTCVAESTTDTMNVKEKRPALTVQANTK